MTADVMRDRVGTAGALTAADLVEGSIAAIVGCICPLLTQSGHSI